MEIVKVRSPYIISVNQALQVEAKVNLYIWNGDIKPTFTEPTVSLTNAITSTGNRECTFNISPYLKDYISNTYANANSIPVVANIDNYVHCEVKKYYRLSTGGYVEITPSREIFGVNGYSEFVEGANSLFKNQLNPTTPTEINRPRFLDNYVIPNNTTSEIFVANSNVNYNNLSYRNGQHLTAYFIPTLTDYYPYIKYTRLVSGFYVSNKILYNSSTLTNGYLIDIPTAYNSTDYNDYYGFIIIEIGLIYVPTNIDIPTDYKYINVLCENKYSPVQCNFINKSGGWDIVTFFKSARKESEISNQNYKVSPANWNYNISDGQEKNFNYKVKDTLKLNTGWIGETDVRKIKELLVSEKIVIYDKEYNEEIGRTYDNVNARFDYSNPFITPVLIKSKSFQRKTYLKDKNINYEIEFEFNFNTINTQQ